MTKELKMLVGVALLAALALAGALGIFTFSAAQPVGAQGDAPTATRSFDPTVGGSGRNRDGDHRIREPRHIYRRHNCLAEVKEMPSGFTYVSSSFRQPGR